MLRFPEANGHRRGLARLALTVVLLASLAACARNPGPPSASTSSIEPPPPAAHPTARVEAESLDAPGLMSTRAGDKTRAAFLAPLSGRAASVGQALLNAAQIAVIDVGTNTFVMQPYDTQGTPTGAKAAAQRALGEGAGLIVGPLFADSVRAIAPLAAQANVPVIAFSTETAVAGGVVNVMGFTQAEQVRRILVHAKNQGRTTLAVLAPETPLGRVTADAARQLAPALGLRISAVETYAAQGRDAGAAIARLTGGGPFDALLIADDGMSLRTVASLLPGAGLQPGQVMILGTMVWQEDPSLGHEAMLVGARYPAADESALETFRGHYRDTYGAVPPVLAGLGYDATALAAVLSRGGPGSFTVNAVRNPEGFVGVGGLFRFRADGTVERGMAVREVTRDGSSQVEAAPTSFTNAVF
ncbi:penicillin-binding protein activator [Pararhodospirillum oryzae]|uniref:Penicillin-binding protein activator n=1 Tax=Pararhodospirillum oryzae TaxID=478448 RepID=A0A512H5Y0_9PROT|nr:penicillin-binding protein activator [Pararhodospirillum oryzae]GEO80853.1 penicillin-binding protein activator [Pararhodospirillum oryzae]